MMFGSKRPFWRKTRSCTSGQMTVELAVVFPVALVMVFIMVNTMMFLAECARFDPLAAEAVRSQAASPGSGQYSMSARASMVEDCLSANFADRANVEVSVSASEVVYGRINEVVDPGSSSGLAFSLLPRQESYTCTMTFHPWGLPRSIFGLKLLSVTHTREFTIDPYRPGVFY